MWGLFVKYKGDKRRTWVGTYNHNAVGDLAKVTAYLAANQGIMRQLGAKDFRVRLLTDQEQTAILNANTY